ncbi:Meiosis specific protein SPO22 [Artemisia annua]|uniref:Meiosis specific protein SPO22 n=1 Tax=Artemisia annua TaxID=35608 RepID=A0A2U1KSM0_ARTAN|nr:Meiosis specific protein SPO22 [Artemisia annua]
MSSKINNTLHAYSVLRTINDSWSRRVLFQIAENYIALENQYMCLGKLVLSKTNVLGVNEPLKLMSEVLPLCEKGLELDLIFNFHKAYYILDEVLIAGELQESSKKTGLFICCTGFFGRGNQRRSKFSEQYNCTGNQRIEDYDQTADYENYVEARDDV